MIRAALPEDTATLYRLAAATEVFYDHEIETLREVLDDYHTGLEGHRAVTLLDDGQVVGFAYFAEVEMTDRTWELWWIVVDPTKQGRGLGKVLMKFVEERLLELKARLLLIETSSLPRYEPTRQFYLKLGYREAARIADFYTAGDDKLVFSKPLSD